MAIPTEISAAAILITFWDDDVSRLPMGQNGQGSLHFDTHPFGSPATLRLISLRSWLS